MTVGARPPRVSRFPASPLVPRAKPALPPISPSPSPTTDEDGKFYDAEDGDACPEALAMYVQKTWKRPEQFMDDQPAVPMLLLKPPPPPPEDGEEPPVDENADPDDPSQPRQPRELVSESVLFSANPATEWMWNALRLVNQRADVIDAGDFLWENIWPKDNDGSDPENPPNPCVSANGKYAVRMWVVDQWRCVWVDDRMPVDVFGRAAFPGARPIQLWPLLLCKATLKVMKHYGVLNRVGSHRVPMVTWLTGWPKENFGVNNAEGALHDRLLNALTDAVPPVRDKHKAKNALPTVYLRERWLPDHPPPRIIALCGPAGVGKQALVDRLCEEYPERFGYGLATTTRPPHAHEVDGTHFHFVPLRAPEVEDLAEGSRNGEKIYWETDLEEEGKLLESGVNVETTLPLVPLTGDKASEVHRRDANGADGAKVKRYRYGTSIKAVSKVAAGGKLLFLTIDVDGCEQLRDNPAVDAYIVHIDTSTPELLRERIKQRLKVDESIVQRMLTEYADQLVLASPGLSDDAGEAEPEEGADEGAEPKEKPPITKRIVHPPQCAESFYKLLLIDDPNDLYYEFKVCCATLSPIVRNRLYGLPPHILDYSDVIPANKTEKVIVKPVILVGPNFLEKAELQRLIFEEFPEVFHRPQIVTTRPLRPDYPAEDDPAEFEDDGMIHVLKDKWTEMEGAGEFATTWKDLYKHETCTYKYAITKASLDEAKEKGLLCVCDVPTAAMADQIKEKYGDETMAIYVGPATLEEYERRLREYFTETDRDLEERLIAAEAEKKRGLDSGLWQSTICLDDPDVAYERLKDIVIQERPDVLPPRDPNEGKPIVPVVLCGPSGVGRKTIYRALDEEFPDRFAYVCSKTTRAAKEGEQAGVHYEYVDRASFESEIADGKFVEYAEIDGELFGTPVEAVQAAHDANKVPVIVVDVQGVTRLREVYPQGAFCLVTPSSVDGLEARIRKIKETPPPPPEGEDDAAAADGDAEGGDEDEVKLPDEPPELTDEQKEEIAERLDKISRQMTGCDVDGLFTDVIVSLDDAPELAYGDLKTAIARVHPKLLVPPPKPLVISGPLGSRKEEVFEALLKEFPDSFGFPLATTTREPEPGEIDGVHYRFVDEATFDAEAEEGKFLECTEVIVGYGEWVDEDVGNPPITVRYGTPFAEVKRLSVEGKMPVLETDAAGAAAMRAAGLDALFVFFAHPTHDAREHERNLADVGEEPDAFPERIAEAEAELAAANEIVQCSKDGTTGTVPERVYDYVLAYEPHRARYARFKEAIALAAPAAVPMRTVWGYGRSRWDPAARVYGNMPTRVAVVGAAASGKSTVAQRLAKALDVPYVYPGALLRDAAYDNPTELGIEAKRYLDSTKTVPDDFMMTLVKDRLGRDDCVVRGWILDGFPHNHYQAKALLDAGHEPDKVCVVEIDHETVFARTRGRLIDPLTGRVFHKEFAPCDELEEGKEVAQRLTIRHDDANEDNVKNRLAKYDFSDAPVRSLFPQTAHFFDGAEAIDDVYQKVEDFVTLEDREHETRHVTDPRTLPLLEYEVLEACVYQRRCCVSVREPEMVNPDSRRPAVWVDVEDFARTAEDFTVAFRTNVFAHANRDARLDRFDLGPGAKMIHVDSPEPTRLAVTLTVAPPEPPPPVPLPAPLVLCGPGADELAATLAARYPAIYRVASIRAQRSPEESEPAADGTDGGENPQNSEAAEGEGEGEDAAAESPSREPDAPEKYPGADSAAAIQAEGLCPVVCLDPAGVQAFKDAHAPPPPELDEDGNPVEPEPPADGEEEEEKPEVPVPTLVCVGLPPMEPKRPRPPPKEESEAEGEEGEKEETPLEDPKPKALTFDHVIYPNVRSLDTPETTFEMLKGVSAVKVRLPLPPKDKVDTSTCEAVLHDYDWYKTGAPQRTVLTLATNTSQSATVRLPRGRHVLQLSVDPGHYFAADVRSQRAFDLDDPAKMLEEKQLAAPSLAEGTYPEMAAGDWHVWFRRVFRVEKPTTVAAALEVPDPAMSPFARFAVVNNDGAGTTTHFVAGAAPPKTFQPNEHGYTVMAYSKALTPVPSGPWRLSALCDVPLASFDDQPIGDPARFDGEYRPNYSHLVCRVRVAIKARVVLALHFESDLPAGFRVTLTDPEDGWEDKQAEYLRGGHKGHLRGVELHAWNAYTMLTVPAMAFEPTENGKYLVLEVKLDNPRCAFDVQPNGDIPSDMRWKLTSYASDPKAAEWTVDTARENYFDQTLSQWNAADGARKSKAEEAYAKRVAELRAREYAQGLENAPPRTPAYRELSGDIATHAGAKPLEPAEPKNDEAPNEAGDDAEPPGPPVIELDPASHRRVLRGTTGGERKVISMATYEAREAHLREQIEASKARLAAYVEARAAGAGARPERASAKRAEFRSWREGTSARVNETARSKRAAYLQSLKRDESGVEEGGDGGAE